MKSMNLHRKLLAALLLSLVTLGMAACSSSEESESCEDKYSNQADIEECKIRGW